jgi:predicted DNA-binding transcriptional regulator AlpA
MSATKLYTTQQAAQIIGYSDSRLRQLIKQGRAKPKQRIGKSWVFTIAEVNRLRARRTTL